RLERWSACCMALILPQIKAPDIAKTAPKVMVWNGPSNRHQKCLTWSRREAPQRKDRSMEKIITVGLDLAKSIFQVHGIAENGKVLVRRTVRRSQVLPFFRSLPTCLVGMEACASAHHWAREIAALGHLVRMMPPAYVLKRNKTDVADAEA